MYQDKIVEILLAGHPRLSDGALDKLTQELNELVEAEVAWAQKANIPARVARLILSTRCSGTDCEHRDGAFDFQMTQGDIANYVGASRSYVSTLMNEWKRDEILRVYGRVTCVIDVKRLQEISDGLD